MSRTVEVPEYEVHGEVRVNPGRTALIVVDMQNDFVKEGGTLVVPDAEGTIPAIQSLLALARGSGMKVVFTQDTHGQGDPEWTMWPEHVREDSWGWRIVDEFAPQEGELVIRKVRYDAFYGRTSTTSCGCGGYAHHLRHRRQHLRSLHRSERGAQVVRRHHPQRRDLGALPVRPGVLAQAICLPVRWQDHREQEHKGRGSWICRLPEYNRGGLPG